MDKSVISEEEKKGQNDFLEKLHKDYEEFKDYLNHVFESYSSEDVDSEIGSTPKDVVFENDILILYKYKGESDRPFLIVSPLINGYYILDLLPEVSFSSFMIKNNYSPYLIRWKNLKEFEKKHDFEYYVRGLKEVVDLIYKKEKKQIVLLGHCLGGLISQVYLASFSNSKIYKYLNLTASINLRKDYLGEIGRITSEMVVDIDSLISRLGGKVPSEFMNFAFQFINPGSRFMAAMSVFHVFFNKKALRLYKALLQWKADNIDMPGEFARCLIRDFFQQNNFFKGNLKIGGKNVKLENIKVPVLNIMAKDDDIAPYYTCSNDNGKIENMEELAIPNGGHLAIITVESPEQYWKKIISWIKKPIAKNTPKNDDKI